MDYGRVEVPSDGGKVPADADIDNIYVKSSTRWYSQSKRIYHEGRESLKEEGFETAADLARGVENGFDFASLTGIGRDSVNKINTIAGSVVEDYRGEGFPWEVQVTVEIPDHMIEVASNAGEEDVEEAILREFEETSLDNLRERLENLERDRLADEREELRSKVEEIESKLEDLNADN